MSGFFDSVTTGTRRFDPTLAARARSNINAQARGLGAGVKNNILDMLRSRGLGRSGKMFGAAGAGSRAQGNLLNKWNLGFDLAEQEFTEGARRFDTQTALALKNLFLNRKMQEEQPKFGIDTPFGGISF